MYKYIIGDLDNTFKLINKIKDFDVILADNIETLKKYKKEILREINDRTILILDIDNDLNVKEIKFFGLKMIFKTKFDDRYIYVFNNGKDLISKNMSFQYIYKLIDFIIEESNSKSILDLTEGDFLSNCFIDKDLDYLGMGKEKMKFFLECHINGNKITFVYIK